MAFSHEGVTYQASKKPDFTDEFIWWSLLRVIPVLIWVKAVLHIVFEFTTIATCNWIGISFGNVGFST